MKLLKAVYFLIIALLAANAVAHPGNTDSMGCHTDRSTGIYHCH